MYWVGTSSLSPFRGGELGNDCHPPAPFEGDSAISYSFCHPERILVEGRAGSCCNTPLPLTSKRAPTPRGEFQQLSFHRYKRCSFSFYTGSNHP